MLIIMTTVMMKRVMMMMKINDKDNVDYNEKGDAEEDDDDDDDNDITLTEANTIYSHDGGTEVILTSGVWAGMSTKVILLL